MIQGYSYEEKAGILMTLYFKCVCNVCVCVCVCVCAYLMEEGCSDIVEMTQQSEETSLLLVVPDLDLVIITSGDKQRLVRVKINATNRT